MKIHHSIVILSSPGQVSYMRKILLTGIVVIICIISGCGKDNGGGGGGGRPPGSHPNVSGTIRKISNSSTLLKATVLTYDQDVSGRLTAIAVANEDSTNGLVTTIISRTEFQYEGTSDKPVSYWLLTRNPVQQWDTVYRVYNVYNANLLVSDSSSRIAYFDRKLYNLQTFTHNGSWIESKRNDVQVISSVPNIVKYVVDSLNMVKGNLIYAGQYDYGNTTSTIQQITIDQSEFDTKSNPLGKLNVAKYLFDRYQFPVYSQNNTTKTTTTVSGSGTTVNRFTYEFSDNDYPVIAYQYQSMNAGAEQLYRTTRYIYK
jgi:hypothetical protein